MMGLYLQVYSSNQNMYNQLFKFQEEVFKALAHSRRLEIIHLLRDQELSVSEIYFMLDLPQANVSQHLKILKEQNIVKTKKEGKKVTYKISRPEFLKIADMIRELIIEKHINYKHADDKQISESSVKDLQIHLQDLVPLTHDLVCGMRVSPKTAGFVHKHMGKNYYFCASGCLEKFKKVPQDYIK